MSARTVALATAIATACLAVGASATARATVATATAVPVDASLFAGLRWRSIGPYRGGRTTSVAGVPNDDRTFYTGAVGGGVWKTENAGRTWRPIMDGQPVSSIGAIAVAPSDPKTVYVGSGEADMRSDIIHGNGMYRSTDAGARWTHAGLEDSQQIGDILVDPRDAKTLLVAALGHAYAASDERGVYRSTDGGTTWRRVLFRDRDTGAIDLAMTPDGATVFASLWQTRRPPWNAYPPSNGPGSGLFVSHDRGVTWRAVRGLPRAGLGKIGVAVARSRPARVYAIVDAKAGGLYRSDDGGTSWTLASGDARIWDRCWYFCHVAVDPADADLVYVSDTSVYRSRDGGATFEAIKGSPDGDDFHELWIDPHDGAHLALASDQGTSVSLDRARTWSSWFNQPTGQFYHVATDDAFPYHVFGAQQDSGAAMILARSDHRDIEARDWRPIAAGGESGYIVPDPRRPGIVYGDKVVREDLRTNQTRSISPIVGRPGDFRDEWTLPLALGPDGSLYFANQRVYRTRDGGNAWTTVSGDLTRPDPGTPATLDAATAADAETAEPRGVVYALAPSPLDASVLWAGTDDGLVRLSRDGGVTWRDVTPRAVTPWSHVSGIEASPHDAASAYVAVDRHRLDDDRPYAYVTHDAGRTWRTATNGLPPGAFVNAIRADPVRPGLLYAATETGVFVSFDDGALWQSLALGMPVVSVRDLVVHDDDLAIATHGRAFWILDDVEPLRELVAGVAPGEARLFAPRVAVRTRAGTDEAEASPPETPAGQNPPNGAFIDYLVPPATAAAPSAPLTVTIADAAGRIVRQYASGAVPPAIDPATANYPAFWISAPVALDAAPGMHRLVWDYHLGDSAGPLAAPGTYVVTFGSSAGDSSRPLVVRRDPRIAASDADLIAQATLALEADRLGRRVHAALARGAIPPLERAALADDARLAADLETSIESADEAPTSSERDAFAELQARVAASLPLP